MSGYIKRYAAPRSWPTGIQKHGKTARKYAPKTAPGPHPQDASLPLGILLQQRGYARTRRELVKVLNGKAVMVDGRRIKDLHFPVGLMDTVSVEGALNARVGQDAKGRVTLTDIPAKEAGQKPCKITGKRVLPGGTVQLGLLDGRSIRIPAKDQGRYAVGDTLLIEVPSQKVLAHLKLEKGASILIIGGRQRGRQAVVEAVDGQTIRYSANGESGETLKKYVFVLAKH
jgi:small subunit ribosomal protein S4e